MLKVESFLGCTKLETGGIIIGWMNLVSDVSTFIAAIFGIVFLSIYDCTDLKKVVERVGGTATDAEFDSICSFGRILLIVLLVVAAIVSVGFAIIAFLCIKGTEKRDHVRVKPMMILLAILTILSFMNVLSLTPHGIISGLLCGIYYGYLFLVVHSLFTVFQTEYEQGITAHYQQPPAKV